MSRKKTKGQRFPAPKTPRWRFLPRRRALRILVWVAMALGYATIMWYLVFPWVDRTFVNRPAL